VEAIAAVRGGVDFTLTFVAELKIKQFWAIPLATNAVAPCPVMAMPLFLVLCQGVANAQARADGGRESRHFIEHNSKVFNRLKLCTNHFRHDKSNFPSENAKYVMTLHSRRIDSQSTN
jgi:hypothetical protein